MIATFIFNATILLALILVPLIYPAALPRMTFATLMEAPARPAEEPKPMPRPEHATVVQTQMQDGGVRAPSIIPKGWSISKGPEILAPVDAAALADSAGTSSPDNPFAGRNMHPDVRQAVKAPAHVSSGVMTGMLIYKVLPKYPPVAVAIHLGGTVVLQATISRNGTIENLRAVGGPALLQQAAIDAVQQWRYRPYLLNREPVEVETTVNVEFTLQ
jgi:protein TonB